MEITEAYILAGGRGERLKPLTDNMPKPLLPVKGKPILEWNIERLMQFGVKRFVIGTGYLGNKIEDYFGDGKDFGVEIEYAKEEKPLGTGGAVKFACESLGERFFMINGDNLADFDYGKMAELHLKKKAEATIALYEVDDVTGYGVAKVEKDKIKEFIEKPKKEHAPSRLINAGAYVLENRKLCMMPDGFCLIEKDFFPHIAKAEKLFGYVHEGQWFPTDTKERYGKAEKEWRGFG